MRKLVLIILLLGFLFPAYSQLAFKDTKKENREKLFRNIIKNTINGNFSKPLNDSTEEYWQDAFWAMLVTNYKSPWIKNKIQVAFSDIKNRTIDFKKGLLEMVNIIYPVNFEEEIKQLSDSDTNSLVFSMALVYLHKLPNSNKAFLKSELQNKLEQNPDNILLQQLNNYYFNPTVFPDTLQLKFLFSKNFLPGQVLLISVQRHNRNQPGLMLFRNAAGEYLKDTNEVVVNYPQLARSLTNLPWFFRNGNTPQGIYKMEGFDVSRSSFIGPTPNLQMRMPFEIWPSQFLHSETPDSTWNIEKYTRLIPRELRNLSPIFESYIAGSLGRTEIIAHGTTIDPEFYHSMPFYPLTPTQGCLTAKEIWDEHTGIIKESDQRKMVDALLKAGGSGGYVLVIEIDDLQKPVLLSDILSFIDWPNK